MPLWAQMLIVCATFSEQFKALVCKALHCRTEDRVWQVSGSFWLRQLTKSLGRRRYCTCLPAVRSLSSCLCTESGEVTYWLLLRLLWCCATCPSPGPMLWPVWSSRHPRWCWTASPGLCADRWSTCKGNRSLEIWAKTLLQSSGCCG